MTERTWFITGVSSGFGRRMTEQLLERGERVVGTLRTPGALDDLTAAHGNRLWLAQLDVTDTSAIRQVVDRAFAEFGHIDVVVNNAGYGILGAAEELTDAQIDHQIATNLVGSIQIARAVIPHMRKQGGGQIIQISTMGGQVTFPGGTLYHASKWGIEGFMDSLRHELAPFRIAVTIVEPGSTGTHFGRNLVVADPLPIYAAGAVGKMRAFFGSGTYQSPGDAGKAVQAIIEVAGQDPPPLRLALGSDAYAAMRRGLVDRLAELESQEAIAASTDRAAHQAKNIDTVPSQFKLLHVTIERMQTMNGKWKMLNLPKAVSDYFAANKGDAEAIATCFTENAVVKDERRTYNGRAEIACWKTEASRKYEYTCTPIAISEIDGEVVVTGRLVGNFPGSPVDLRYFFSLEDGKISALETAV